MRPTETDPLRAALDDLLDPATKPDPRDVLRAADAVREAREAADALGLGAADMAGAAVLRLASTIDTGSRVVTSDREALTHAVALALLVRSPVGAAACAAAGWSRHDVTAGFRTWLDAVAAERSADPDAPRARLALAAARARGAADPGDRAVARLVAAHGRRLPVDAGDVPGALLLARENGARVDGLLKRSRGGLRWVERRARDLVEGVTPRHRRHEVADAAIVAPQDDPRDAVAAVESARRVRDVVDELRARGPQFAAAIEWFEAGESRAAVAERHGVTAEAVRWAERRIRAAVERFADDAG